LPCHLRNITVEWRRVDTVVIGLAIAALVVSTFAVLPYAVELLLRVFWKPRFDYELGDLQTSSYQGKLDLRFEFRYGLVKGKASFIRSAHILFPLDEVELYPHPEHPVRPWEAKFTPYPWSKGVWLGQDIQLWSTRIVPKQYFGTPIALRTSQELESLELGVRITTEIDESELGFWGIFYRARSYSVETTMNLAQLSSQKPTEPSQVRISRHYGPYPK